MLVIFSIDEIGVSMEYLNQMRSSIAFMTTYGDLQ